MTIEAIKIASRREHNSSHLAAIVNKGILL
jgi:hypothetical protein